MACRTCARVSRRMGCPVCPARWSRLRAQHADGPPLCKVHGHTPRTHRPHTAPCGAAVLADGVRGRQALQQLELEGQRVRAGLLVDLLLVWPRRNRLLQQDDSISVGLDALVPVAAHLSGDGALDLRGPREGRRGSFGIARTCQGRRQPGLASRPSGGGNCKQQPAGAPTREGARLPRAPERSHLILAIPFPRTACRGSSSRTCTLMLNSSRTDGPALCRSTRPQTTSPG
jgi:hypothetical protein